MFVKVEVVGAPGSHNTVTQCQIMPHQMQMTYSMSQPPFTLGPIMAPAPQMAPVPAPSLAPPAAAQPPKMEEPGRLEALRAEILRREPVEPARSQKQLFLSDYVKKARKKDKKKWLKMLEPQRQRYIEAYTVFVRGLNKEELELYTEMKARRDAEDEAKRATESSDEEESETSEDETDDETDSESGSDSDV